MTVLQAYQIFLTLRMHFTQKKFDIRTNQLKYVVTNEMLDKKPKIRYSLKHLSEKYTKEQFVHYLVANFVNGDTWGGIFVDGTENYLQWQKTQDSLTYTFTQDMEHLRNEVSAIADLWDCSDGHPPLVTNYFGKRCTLETLAILNKLYRFKETLDSTLLQDPVWESISMLLEKYSPFITVDKDKYSMITEKVFA
jgi:hypothetical protein